jgi:hypothetical protein
LDSASSLLHTAVSWMRFRVKGSVSPVGENGHDALGSARFEPDCAQAHPTTSLAIPGPQLDRKANLKRTEGAAPHRGLLATTTRMSATRCGGMIQRAWSKSGRR